MVYTAKSASGEECPDCHGTNIMDNGERLGSRDLSYCCGDCGAQWDADAARECVESRTVSQ